MATTGDKNGLDKSKRKDANAETKKDKGKPEDPNEIPPFEDEFAEERDESMPDLDFDDVTDALDEFIKEREEQRNKADAFGGAAVKDKGTSNKEDNEEAEKQRKKEAETW